MTQGAEASTDAARRGDVQALLEAFRRRDAVALQTSAQRGIDLESQDADGCAVLHLAAAAGEPGTVQWILEAGAAIGQVAGPGPWRGQDALMRAAEAGHGGVVDLLLAAGAEPTRTDAWGRRAIDLAHAAGQDAIVRRLTAVSGGPPRPRSEASRGTALSHVEDRGLGRDDGDDVCILVRAAPADVAGAWQTRIEVTTWLPDAYGTEVRLQGRCFLVFRFQGHPWTLLRAAHEAPDPGFDASDAAHLSRQLEVEAIFLRHQASESSLTYRHYLDGELRLGMDVPAAGASPTAASGPGANGPGDAFDDHFEDGFEDTFDDVGMLSGMKGDSEPATSWHAAVRRVDRHLRSLDAYAPSWGRLDGEHHRLEVAGLHPEAFERMDFLAVESLYPEAFERMDFLAVESACVAKKSEIEWCNF